VRRIVILVGLSMAAATFIKFFLSRAR